MSLVNEVTNRADNKCELCSSTTDLNVIEVSDSGEDQSSENHALICKKCENDFSSEAPDVNHWRCLTGSMWSEYPAVQVLSYRMLHKLKSESWANELLDQMYMEEDNLNWAKRGISNNVKTLDSNGAELKAGDSVTLIKDLNVKGGGFTAKRGTKVTGIRLTDDPGYIEGRVEGQMIVLKVEFLKKG